MSDRPSAPSGALAVVLLAAGEGKRMRSSLPKVLHEIGGRSLVGHALAAARGLSPDHLAVVVRHGRDQVVERVTRLDPAAVIADQDDVPGTGRAVACGLAALPAAALAGGTVVVTYGDVPLLTTATLKRLVAVHGQERNAVTVLTAHVADPTGYGRVLRDPEGLVRGIVEHRDAAPHELEITEINSGIYVFAADVLTSALKRVGSANDQGEVYLTDTIGIARADGHRVGAVVTDDVAQVEGVNDRVQLAALGAELNRRVVEGWMRSGVTVVDPATTWVDVDARLAPDVTLRPGTQVLAGTTVATGAVVGPDTTLEACEVGAGAEVVRSHGRSAVIGAGADVGPFSYLRPGTVLGAEGKIGAFVETKNVTIGERSKVPHLSYVGDATIGRDANIGAATVFVNYDGVAKHRTTVGDGARVGSDTMLVAPVVIGDGAYTAAGSVITEDVPSGALGVARGRQRNIPGWVGARRPGSVSAKAAEAAGDAGEGPAGP
ncbi:bifunctional UDP-N-acetylglucosamine diphosphorylase/glucosamine-1-phosphate N-acetyltransferase GlmU [Spongisporangium articulatum]|uniref:Bifunctional protein GlmU n=1 Tax=Spongisporangium articulatum TaxID=3362603 RepID=A0ABW8ASZ7_9ACTN